MLSETILQSKNIQKYYQTNCALSKFNLEVNKGQVWGILGPNGSGKTTALSILLGIIEASAGEYKWHVDNSLAYNIGSLVSEATYYPWLNVKTNLNLMRIIKNIHDKKEIIKNLNKFEMTNNKNKKAKHLSKGMKIRMALASATMGDPTVLVLDEPTNGLDPIGIIHVRKLIKDLAAKNKAIIIASHILSEIEKTCTHVLILNKGKTIFKESLADITNKKFNKITARQTINLQKYNFANDSTEIINNNKDTALIKSTLTTDKLQELFPELEIANIDNLEDLYMNLMENR